ncbi:MAG: toll/interleukin-1 receptor domain-containing protein [Isosphaeraceae bacterium]|nr:toll/interleukin-1 receptor domain-containing protein [Isosphaeraceae bacterium]
MDDRTRPDPPAEAFDLFISYAHKDDRDEHAGKVEALVEAIKADYERVCGTKLRVFFDTNEIRSMDDWELRILRGLRESKMMVAVLSPSYFSSDYCRKEWEHYVETELAQALPGEGIAPIYIVAHPSFDGDIAALDDRLRHWVKDLKRRQYIDWKEFWPEGARALEKADVRRRLEALPGQISERLRRASVRDGSPHTVPLPSVRFVGRRDEMHALREALVRGQIGAITAVHGIPGIGKSMLAFAYAWGYGFEYPGGRYMINAANLGDLAGGVIALAEPMGVPLSDAERLQPELALAKVKAAFESRRAALIVVDNLDDPALLSASARERALPKGDHIHVLVTTRAEPAGLPLIHCLTLDALQTEDALALLHAFRPLADSPQDDEWKAALAIVGRLGGHALAVEVVGVFLQENPDCSYRAFAESLERDGISLVDETAALEAEGRLAWHTETSIARLLEPTLAALAPDELRLVEYAALLPPDNLPFPWLRELMNADFPPPTRSGPIDPAEKRLQRLDRLRLVVPQTRDGARARGGSGVPAGDARLGRMHRLVQEIVLERMSEIDRLFRDAAVHAAALERGRRIQAEWGRPGLAWELAPLRDLAARWIDSGEREAALLADRIAKPLEHSGRMFESRDLWLRSAELFRRRLDAHPENADDARDLSISYNKLGDLAISSGDPAAARRYYEDGLAIRKRLSAAAPENADYARDLAGSHLRLGGALAELGQPGEGREHLRLCLEVLRGMKARGMHLDPEAEQVLEALESMP